MRENDRIAGAIVLIGTLDTKGDEYAFLRRQITDAGVETIVVDLGIIGEPRFVPDVSADEVARSAGSSLAELRTGSVKADSIATMARGAATLVRGLYDEGSVAGIVALGGGQGTHMTSTAMRALPVGVPKLIVSTAGGIDGVKLSSIVGNRDVMVMNSVVDISGLNALSRTILGNAAAAITGMVSAARDRDPESGRKRFRVSATMFGVTTRCVTRVREALEARDCEVTVFAATGSGDRAMEDLMTDGFIDGVIDITPSQVGQDLIRSADRAGPQRLEVAGRLGLPQVIVPGGLDIVNINTPDDPILDEVKAGTRKWLMHNPELTVVRPTVEESRRVGELIARKLNAAQGPVTVVVPTRGWSDYSILGGPLYDPEADEALVESLERQLRVDIPVFRLPLSINDPEFAEELVAQFIALLPQRAAESHERRTPASTDIRSRELTS